MRQGSKRATRNSNRSGLLTGGLLTLMCVPALAGPEGERVVRGSAEFQRAGDVTTIVAADRTIINYRSFDIGAGETVRFVQPDADSRVLNRIKSATPTQIAMSATLNVGQWSVTMCFGLYFATSSLPFLIQSAR